MIMDQLMFCVVFTTGAKLCLILPSRDVKSCLISALAGRGNGPKCWKTLWFDFFVGAQQCSCSQTKKIGKLRFALAGIFTIPEPYKTVLGYV